MSVGFVYVLLNESYIGLVKLGKSTRHPNQRAKELSGTGVLHPYLVAYFEKVSDCDLAEKRVHEELKQFREKQNREFFKVSSTKAVKVIRRIAKEVNSQIPFPVPPRLIFQPPPVRLYAVSFTCEGCGHYRSNTVEHHASKVKCPACQHENNLNIAWS
jgi:hypothetical protein